MVTTTKLENGVTAIQNFDWEVTKRKLCIFMPHYYDRKYTDFSLRQIKTQIPKNDYVFVVGNNKSDGEFEEFEGENVYSFLLKRPDGSGSRNGCFVRNYAIKRCQSYLFLQKDGNL